MLFQASLAQVSLRHVEELQRGWLGACMDDMPERGVYGLLSDSLEGRRKRRVQRWLGVRMSRSVLGVA